MVSLDLLMFLPNTARIFEMYSAILYAYIKCAILSAYCLIVTLIYYVGWLTHVSIFWTCLWTCGVEKYQGTS